MHERSVLSLSEDGELLVLLALARVWSVSISGRGRANSRGTKIGTWHLPSLPCRRSQQPLTSPDQGSPYRNEALVAGIPTIMTFKRRRAYYDLQHHVADWTVLRTAGEPGNRSRSLNFSCCLHLLTKTFNLGCMKKGKHFTIELIEQQPLAGLLAQLLRAGACGC